MEDYLLYYDKERYLFDNVHNNFKTDGFISAFDFFCILIWKAERKKSVHKRRLLDNNPDKSLDQIIKELTKSIYDKGIYNKEAKEERLRVLLDKRYKFLLPTASAILSVFYPVEFTVYDIRVSEQLDNELNPQNKLFQNLANKTKFDDIWKGYEKYIKAVENFPACKHLDNLRDKDRFLWGRSFKKDLDDLLKNDK